jgi:hypothetical protein
MSAAQQQWGDRMNTVFQDTRQGVSLDKRELASLGARLLAQFIDWAIAVGIALLMFPLEKVSQWLVIAALYGGLAYYLLCDGLPRQSLGKELVSIATVNSDSGLPCGYGRSAVRNISQVL